MLRDMDVPQFDRQNRQAKQKEKIQSAPDGQRERVLEEQSQVLRPAFDHGDTGAVHACGDSVVGVTEPKPDLTALGDKSHFHVLEYLVAHSLVSADAPV